LKQRFHGQKVKFLWPQINNMLSVRVNLRGVTVFILILVFYMLGRF